MKAKKFLSWLLVLCMVFSLLPGMSLTASAEEGNPFTLTAQDNTVTVSLAKKPTGAAYQYSTDGKTWNDFTATVTVNDGESIAVRMDPSVKAADVTYDTTHFLQFKGAGTGTLTASGDVMSLVAKDAESLPDRAFVSLFFNVKQLADASELVLPADDLSNSCFSNMFRNCTALTGAPELSATELAEKCYSTMFYGCTALTEAPELPASELATYCYGEMFSGCTALTEAPELPATELAKQCYDTMFKNCTALTNAPELPADTLAENCYQNMFSGCTALTDAPELPATTLEKNCYQNMFNGCTALTETPELPAETLAVYCYAYMFRNCTALTAAPELPADTLESGCYQNMFQNCTGLKIGTDETKNEWKIPATEAAEYWNLDMFTGCTGVDFDGKGSTVPALNTTYYQPKVEHEHNGATFTSWTSSTSLPTKAGNYYLDTDVTISSTWDFSNISRSADIEINLCLNGHAIKLNGTNKSVIKLNNYAGRAAKLSVYDCSTTEHKFSVDQNGLWKLDETNGTETVVGGVITGGTNSGVYIDNNTTNSKQVFNLYGGNIVGNSTSGSGGGVANKYDVFNMYGGSIFGNTAVSAGGVQVMHGTFTMTGGTIHHNTATDKGGGVALTGANGDATFTMSNAEIQNNKAPHFGGVFNSSGKICLSGKNIIKNNTDANGNPSNVGTYPVITINGALTGSEIYICKSSANGSFATEGALTKDYISKSGASATDDLDKFFHYDGPSQYELLLKDNEIYMQKLTEAVSVEPVKTMPSFTYGAATEAAKIADVTAKNFTGTANCSVVGWYDAATDGTALTSNTPTAVLVGTELKITTTAATPAGDYYLELSASNGTVTKTTRVKVTVAKDTNTLTGTPSVSGWTYGATPGTASGVTSKYGTVSYKYYSDAACTTEITPSSTTAAGIYYVKAYVAEGDNYNEANSSPVSFTISKADATEAMKTASGNLKAKSGSTQTISFTNLPASATFGTLNGAISGVTAVIENNALKVTVGSTDLEAGTSAFTVTVPVNESTNYNAYNIAVTVTPTFNPTFDLRDGNGEREADSEFNYNAPVWKTDEENKDYTFAGWSETIDGTTYVSKGSDDTYDATDFAVGKTYYAVWTKNDKIVLTLGIEVKPDGIYIGGSETKASDETLAKYGLGFTAASGEDPLKLTMNNTTIDVNAAEDQVVLEFNAAVTDTDMIVSGNNSIILSGTNEGYGFGIYNDATVSGSKMNLSVSCAEGSKEASLTVDASGAVCKETTSGIQLVGDFALDEKVTMTAAGGKAVAAKAYAYGIGIWGTVTIDGTLYAFGGDSNSSSGCSVTGDATINGTVNAVGGNGTYANGLNMSGNLVVNGTVNATGGKGTSEYYGLWTNGNVTVNKGGELNLYACDEESANKGAMYLETKEDKTFTINGTVTADAIVKNDGKYADGYTVTGATSDITKDGVTLTLAEGKTSMTIAATEYNFTFNADGGTPAPEAGKTLAYIEVPDDMTKEGYKFGGWYTDKDFTSAYNFGDETTKGDYIRENTTFYAKWIKDDAKASKVDGATVKTGETGESAAIVELFRGDEKVAATVTDADGKYDLPTLPYGEYMLVITKNPGEANEQIITKLITIGETNEGTDVTIPSKNVSSVVEITEDTPSKIVVGGLDEVANAQNPGTGSVTVTMTVESMDENEATGAEEIKALDDAKNKTVEFLDMSIFAQAFKADGTKDGDPSPIHTPDNLMKVIFSYNMSGKKDIAVLRYHGTTAALMNENPDAGEEGFVVDETNGTITVWAENFSTYAIAYTQESRFTGGGSSSNSITAPASVEHGKVTVDKKSASPAETVTITVTPDKGYVLDTLTVKDANGKAVELTKVNDTTYTFKMPSSKVTISATFVKTGTCPQDETCVYAKFTDADTKAWYHDGVHFCVENGYMQGVSQTAFDPSGTTTRAMIVTMLWRLDGEPTVNYAMSFKDVADGQWYTKAIRWAQSTGVVEGYSNEAFGPDDPITREQMAAILYRFAKNHEIDVTNSNTLASFTDTNKVSTWALDAMKWANAVGLVQGRTTTTLVPEADITRAEAATMVQRYCEKVCED